MPAAAPRGGAQIPANSGRITLEVNKGTLVRLSGPAATVFVANPDIADVQVKSPTLVYISVKAPGETVIYAVDASDSVLLNAAILVEHDVSRLRSSLRQLAPGHKAARAFRIGEVPVGGVPVGWANCTSAAAIQDYALNQYFGLSLGGTNSFLYSAI